MSEISFGERLRQFREAAGLTQEQLAERAGLTAKGISVLERGKRRHPYPHTVQVLATALGLSDQELAMLMAAIPKRNVAPPALAQPVESSSLPWMPTPLLGRERELSEISRMLGFRRGGRGAAVLHRGFYAGCPDPCLPPCAQRPDGDRRRASPGGSQRLGLGDSAVHSTTSCCYERS